MSTDDLSTQVRRYGHGSRVPGWDDAADLTKDPSEVPDAATTAVPAELRAEIEEFMARYPDRRSAAIPALAAVQHRYGWCTPEGVEQAACVMRLTPGYLMAVATFYDMLETTPVGRNTVYVCTNISCSLLGADRLLEHLQAEIGEDPDFNVRPFECLGACDIAPMASVNGMYVGPIGPGEVSELVDQLRAGADPLPDRQLRRAPTAERRWAGDIAGPDVASRAPSDAPLPPEPAAFGPPMGRQEDRGEQAAPQERAPDPGGDAP